MGINSNWDDLQFTIFLNLDTEIPKTETHDFICLYSICFLF